MFQKNRIARGEFTSVLKRIGGNGSSTPCSCATDDDCDTQASFNVETLKKKYVGPDDGNSIVVLNVPFV